MAREKIYFIRSEMTVYAAHGINGDDGKRHKNWPILETPELYSLFQNAAT